VSAPATRSAREGSFRSLRVRNYRLFAGGQLVSLTGTWMQMTAQDWLVVELGGGGLGLGGVLALQFLPTLLFGLYGGVVADRVDKRRLLLITQTTSGVLAASMAWASAAGEGARWNRATSDRWKRASSGT